MLVSMCFLEGACPCALSFLPLSHLPGLFNQEKTKVERVGRTEHSSRVGEGGGAAMVLVLLWYCAERTCSAALGL